MTSARSMQLPGVLPRFFGWWRRELRNCIPSGLRDWRETRGQMLLVDVASAAAVLRVMKGDRHRDLGTVARSPGGSAPLPAVVAKRLRRVGSVNGIVAQIDAKNVLRHRLRLPLATNENLREVLSYEMDRVTPFRSDDVYFDFRVAETDAAAGQIVVDLFLVRRPVVDDVVALLRGWNLPPDRVTTVLDAAKASGEVNFLAAPNRRRSGRLRRNLFALLTLAIAAGAAVSVNLALQQQTMTLDAYEVALAELRIQVQEVDTLKQQLMDRTTRSQYVAAKKSEQPLTIAVVSELTRLLPDDTWLTQVRIQQRQLIIAGSAPGASDLIALLEASPLLSQVKFSASVVPDPKTGKERFNITAVIGQSDGRS